ncbi:MAG: spiro-SPASM protein [Spirochaetaceae bacterium]|jgi:spiro-SPASM protein|nr:spiro-SPASM protein [Spirochaetaceae bacterium]
MNALAVLYGGSLTKAAFEKVLFAEPGGEAVCALTTAIQKTASFPGVTKIILLVGSDFERRAGDAGFAAGKEAEVRVLSELNVKTLLRTLAELSRPFDLLYFAWADAPFLDRDLAGKVAERHLRYAAEYSYADGWPYGLAPEILAPSTAGVLAALAEGDQSPVDREALFQVIRKDINAFDIETEISPVDLRSYRLSLTADSRRNLLLLTRFQAASGSVCAAGVERLIVEKPELLRTLPAFYAIQVSGPCPQACALCPYPRFPWPRGEAVTARRDFMDPACFEELLDAAAAFSGDAVIDLSLWGELALHPQKMELIRMVLDRRDALSLIIETSGIGWKQEELETLARMVQGGRPLRPWTAPPGCLSWIVSLDAAKKERYGEARGPGFEEAVRTAQTLVSLFPQDAYVQAIRLQGAEDDIETFYRSWKDRGAQVIIQKYDDFCGFLPKMQAADLSPVRRHPCWHLMRDMYIFIDGRVSLCREDFSVLAGITDPGNKFSNVFDEPLEVIWSRGEERYREHCAGRYTGICGDCDEYYTFNF